MSKSGSVSGTYAFDLYGNMLTSSANDSTASYTYDGNGIRTSKTVNGVTTSFINDSGYVVGEVSGDSIIKYTYGNNLISINNNGTLGYYHTDEHGNVSAISNRSWDIVADYDFDAFGNETVSTDTYYNPMRYCGEYYDAETDLIYLRARYYDPSIGRFISEDPIKDGTNWYVYCSNNPIAFVDPTGLTETNLVLFSVLSGNSIVNYDSETQTYTLSDGTTYTNGVNGAHIVGSMMYIPVPEPEPKEVLSFTANVGTGMDIQVGAAGVVLELGAKRYYNVNDTFSDEPTQSMEFSADVSVTDEIQIGGSITGTINAQTGEHIGNEGFIGVQFGDHTLGYNSSPKDGDITLTLITLGGYFVAGGEIDITLNLSELYRRLFE